MSMDIIMIDGGSQETDRPGRSVTTGSW